MFTLHFILESYRRYTVKDDINIVLLWRVDYIYVNIIRQASLSLFSFNPSEATGRTGTSQQRTHGFPILIFSNFFYEILLKDCSIKQVNKFICNVHVCVNVTRVRHYASKLWSQLRFEKPITRLELLEIVYCKVRVQDGGCYIKLKFYSIYMFLVSCTSSGLMLGMGWGQNKSNSARLMTQL